MSKSTKCEFNVDKANQILEAAGWKKGSDGIRAKDGKKLKFVYQTSINALAPEDPGHRQAGGGQGRHRDRDQVGRRPRCSSPPTWPTPTPTAHFYTDIQMYTTTMTQPDPELFMRQFLTEEVASKDNKWQGRNITRWRNDEYDKLFKAAESRSSIRSSAPRCSSR